MTKVTISDFGILYDALSVKKAALPVKLLRRFKDELYTFALTQQPGPTMQVASPEDGRIDENMLALTIGLASTGVYGLVRAVNSEQWYRNIILHDSLYSCEKMLEFLYPELAKQSSWKLPVWYHITRSVKRSELAEEKASRSYSEIVTDSAIQRNRSAIAGRSYCSETNLSQLNRWCRLIIAKAIGFLIRKSGIFCKINSRLLFSHHNKHAHALTETIDTFLAPE